MRRLLLLIHFTAQSSPPLGTPPSRRIDSGPGDITVVANSAPDTAVPASAQYTTTVTGTDTFDETGTYRLGEHTFQVTTFGTGKSEPSGMDGYQRGAVSWRIFEEATGASGIVTSNIEIDEATGTADDRHIVRLYLP
ncbi:hypothetical protein TPA0910_75410 [Streptomyces hygroscopicus subsp. sporocinereus]|uniref:Allene oxide cyclase barrel-like domain-containing protein n=1 Tax=Streptomyces hygroscopicus TaxID=1912 RepID=A0ABQ3UBX5_STRHY|nr:MULTISPECIES: hypothetical protein [Streptomyces]MDN3054074.1 hypothetical protein [Streptomyces sp. SRF1]GHJ33108.1 hypothetical protein TPA0910_75410 [Streptomyces hygroscopicus]